MRMSLLDWFNTREVDDFARRIADDLIKRVHGAGGGASDTRTRNALLKTQNWAFDRIAHFARGRSFNLYQKASFGNTLKWALQEAAFAPEAADAWAQELVTHLALSAKAK
jgi:hypothetical protein